MIILILQPSSPAPPSRYYVPPATQTVLGDLHPAIWWGAIMFVLGLFYTFKFWPKK